MPEILVAVPVTVTPVGVAYEEFCLFNPPEILRVPAPVTALTMVPVLAK